MEQIKDTVVLEQFLNCLSPTIHTWIKERKPKSVLEAGHLADDYTEARRQVKGNSSGDTIQKGKPSTPTPEEVQPVTRSNNDKRNKGQR